jgi:predicted RNA-binding Zn-ribbon protein involved in translation (DUF1610 family)
MSETKKMLCPDCGAEMNHHALKIDYTAAPEVDDATIDPQTGGRLVEAHTCPECGRIALRDAGEPA